MEGDRRQLTYDKQYKQMMMMMIYDGSFIDNGLFESAGWHMIVEM